MKVLVPDCRYRKLNRRLHQIRAERRTDALSEPRRAAAPFVRAVPKLPDGRSSHDRENGFLADRALDELVPVRMFRAFWLGRLQSNSSGE